MFPYFFLQIIPKKFVDNFGGKISRTIELESSNGNMYVFEVSKHMGNTVIHRGWQAFIDEHHIEENDSLLFRHIENSRFEVLVLDSDDCEKVFFCPGINIAGNISNSSRDYTTRSPGSKRFAMCERGNSSHPRKAEKTALNYSLPEDSGCLLILFCIDVLSVIYSQYVLYYNYIEIVFTVEIMYRRRH